MCFYFLSLHAFLSISTYETSWELEDLKCRLKNSNYGWRPRSSQDATLSGITKKQLESIIFQDLGFIEWLSICLKLNSGDCLSVLKRQNYWLLTTKKSFSIYLIIVLIDESDCRCPHDTPSPYYPSPGTPGQPINIVKNAFHITATSKNHKKMCSKMNGMRLNSKTNKKSSFGCLHLNYIVSHFNIHFYRHNSI